MTRVTIEMPKEDLLEMVMRDLESENLYGVDFSEAAREGRIDLELVADDKAVIHIYAPAAEPDGVGETEGGTE